MATVCTAAESFPAVTTEIIGPAEPLPIHETELSQNTQDFAEARWQMAMTAFDKFMPRILRIAGTDDGVSALPDLLRKHDPAMVYVSFAGHPRIEATRELLSHVLTDIRKAGSVVPNPMYIGIESVDENWKDDFQRGVVIEGVGGFIRDSTDTFVAECNGQLIDGATSRQGDAMTPTSTSKSAKARSRRRDAGTSRW